MRLNLLLMCAIPAMTLAACERPERADPAAAPYPAGPIDQSEAEPVAEPTAECVNESEGYALEYPASWHVYTGDLLGPCSLFHPEPFEVPAYSEVPMEIAIMIDIEPVPYGTFVGDMVGRTTFSRAQTSIDGRQASRIEGETTGEGLHPPGIGSYEYFVDLGGATLIAVTYDAGGMPFERKRRVLDAMMSTLEFVRQD